MSNSINYNGYVASIEFDPEHEVLRGRVVNARDPLTFEARSADEVLGRFRDVIDTFLAECEEQGTEPQKPYSGKLLVRIDAELHAAMAADAARLGWSINRYAERAIQRAVSAGDG